MERLGDLATLLGFIVFWCAVCAWFTVLPSLGLLYTLGVLR